MILLIQTPKRQAWAITVWPMIILKIKSNIPFSPYYLVLSFMGAYFLSPVILCLEQELFKKQYGQHLLILLIIDVH